MIGLLDATDAHHDAAVAALTASEDHGDRLAMAASAFAGCLVGPSRHGPGAVRTVEELLARVPIEVVDLDRGTARAAAGLRSRHRKLRLPDALVVATAAERRADRLLTSDHTWPTARAMKLELTIVRL